MAVGTQPPGSSPGRDAATREAAAEFDALFAAAVDALIVINAQGLIIEFNPAAERLFGYGQDEVVGQDVAILMPEPHRSRHADYLVRFLTSGEAKIIGIGRQVDGQRKDGSEFPMQLSVGEVVSAVKARFVGIVRDLTQQKAAEEETRRLQNRLAHVGRFSIMGEMAAGLAHEINQPLGAITTYAQAGKRLLDKGADAGEMTELCVKIAGQAQRAGQVIENLRNFIRKQEVHKDHLDLNSVVADIVSLINVDARGEGILVDVEYWPEPLPVCGDAIQIQQVLVNLTRNAVDAMKQGLYKERGIHVQTRRADDDHKAEVRVTDHGHGVPAQLADSIFHPFVSTKRDGLGIGLAISRTIAQGHGGDLTYRPNPTGGSVFGFSLPISEEE